MNSKMTINSQPNLKKKLSKKLEPEQSHRNADHMEGYQWGNGRGIERDRYRK